MSAQHTQGPWRSKLKSTPFSDFGIYDDSGSLVATVAHNPRYSSAARRKADAQLIAAAPELLKACQLFVEYERQSEGEDSVAMMLSYSAAHDAIRAAIAKATGSAA